MRKSFFPRTKKFTFNRGVRRVAMREFSAREAGKASDRARRKKRDKKTKEAARLKNGLYGISDTKVRLLKKAKHVNLTSNGVALCPKCKSDKWAYVETSFLLIPIDYFVCMKCGHAQHGHHESWASKDIEFTSIK